MQVVTAGVHVSVDRCVVESGGFGDGQGIHVSAQQNRGTGHAAAEHGDDRAEALTCGDLEWQALERVEDLLLSEGQLESQLRVAVEHATQVTQFGGQGQSLCPEVSRH